MKFKLFSRFAALAALALLAIFVFSNRSVHAYESLGVGTDALLGGDLTDPEDDGDPEEGEDRGLGEPGLEEGHEAHGHRGDLGADQRQRLAAPDGDEVAGWPVGGVRRA